MTLNIYRKFIGKIDMPANEVIVQIHNNINNAARRKTGDWVHESRKINALLGEILTRLPNHEPLHILGLKLAEYAGVDLSMNNPRAYEAETITDLGSAFGRQLVENFPAVAGVIPNALALPAPHTGATYDIETLRILNAAWSGVGENAQDDFILFGRTAQNTIASLTGQEPLRHNFR